MSSEFDVDPQSQSGGGRRRGLVPTARAAGNRPAPSKMRTFSSAIVMCVIILVVVGGGSVGFWQLFQEQSVREPTPPDSRSGSTPGPPASLDVSYDSGDAEARDTDESGNVVRAYPLAPGPPGTTDFQSAAEQQQIAELFQQAKQTKSDLEALQAETKDWTGLVKALEDDERGRKLAASSEHLPSFVAVTNRHLDEQQTVKELSTTFDKLYTPLSEAAYNAQSEFTPSLVFRSELTTAGEAIQSQLAKLREDRESVDAILAVVAELEPGEQTLAEAKNVLRQAEAVDRAKRIAAEVARAKREADEKIAQAEAARIEAEKAIEEFKHREQEAELLAEKKRLEADAKTKEEARQRAAELARLEAEFEAAWPNMQFLLLPFTSDGYGQPSSSRGFKQTAKKGPVSFSKLQAVGVLKQDGNAIQNFMLLGLPRLSGNDRPAGGFPNYEGDIRRIQDTLVKIQTFLRTYGPVMVDKKLLAP